MPGLKTIHPGRPLQLGFIGGGLSSAIGPAHFSACRLDRCDFREATNYLIDPSDNSIEEAQFCSPEVLGLLSSFNIGIDRID